MIRRIATHAAMLGIAVAAPAASQEKEPPRPKLEQSADTNDPRAYYSLGERLLARDARKASEAFYWAMRLDPSWADALYARRTALLMRDGRRLVRYVDGDRRTIESAEVRRIDSLQVRAMMTNPFFYRRYERKMMDAYIVQAVNGGRSTDLSPSEIQFAWDGYLRQAPAATRGWAAYADGRFSDALRAYGTALGDAKRKAYLRTERGRIFQMTGRPDSALAMLRLAADELRREDNKELVLLYDSKAFLEFSIGKIHESMDQRQQAREAYGRALQEDLAFYPAHVALAGLAVAEGDTATVISEMELAVQLSPGDPMIHLLYGYSLASLGKASEAIAQLEKASAAEPLFARPYRLLGQVHEQMGNREQAVRNYELFLARSARTAPDYEEGAARLAALKAGEGSR